MTFFFPPQWTSITFIPKLFYRTDRISSEFNQTPIKKQYPLTRSPGGHSLSLSTSLSSFQAGIVSLFLKCGWILCVRESEHLSRKLPAKNSPGASAHMSSDKATHVKEPRYHSSFIALRLRLPIPSIRIDADLFLSRRGLKKLKCYSSFTWQQLLCLSS